jgi:hypothetical protein
MKNNYIYESYHKLMPARTSVLSLEQEEPVSKEIAGQLFESPSRPAIDFNIKEVK